jgi:hypothetical protein
VHADFNNDGKLDTAMILESQKGLGIGLFVDFSDSKNDRQHICLYNSETDSANTENLSVAIREKVQKIFRATNGIRLVRKGVYKTACGKGFFDCMKGKPKQVNLDAPGISFFQYDAGFERYYFWNAAKGKFENQQMRDRCPKW